LKPLAVGEVPVVTLEVANSGHTPARDTIVAGSVFSRAQVVDADFSDNVGGPIDSRSVVGPGVPFFIPIEATQPVKQQGQIDAILKGKWKLHATGNIWYKDIFGKQHRTQFCF